ncbi:MAG: hypothetical protein KAV87_00785, partial [Desulfobacteraceae bacterium]|nr:hypothetical protein [Desulfobacteraceae bacterium]
PPKRGCGAGHSDSVMKLTGQPMHTPHRIYGIDFSGAKDVGKKRICRGCLGLKRKLINRGKKKGALSSL